MLLVPALAFKTAASTYCVLTHAMFYLLRQLVQSKIDAANGAPVGLTIRYQLHECPMSVVTVSHFCCLAANTGRTHIMVLQSPSLILVAHLANDDADLQNCLWTNARAGMNAELRHQAFSSTSVHAWARLS